MTTITNYWTTPDGKQIPYTQKTLDNLPHLRWELGGFWIQVTYWPQSASVEVVEYSGVPEFPEDTAQKTYRIAKVSKADFEAKKDTLISIAREKAQRRYNQLTGEF